MAVNLNVSLTWVEGKTFETYSRSFGIMSIGENTPPRNSSTKNTIIANGTALYYYMENVITFSYSIAPLDIDGSLDYYLFIKPSNEGDYVNAVVRSSEW
jgi:hypothetical protein